MKPERRKVFRLAGKMAPWKKAVAKKMAKRRNMSRAERVLWDRLKDKGIGVNFYKQKPMLGYILDFWCPAAALCVEVDGPHHAERTGYDARRDVALLKEGVLTMRFDEKTVRDRTNVVVAMIADKVERRKR